MGKSLTKNYFVSVRVVEAATPEEAQKKVEAGDFIDTHPVSDKIYAAHLIRSLIQWQEKWNELGIMKFKG